MSLFGGFLLLRGRFRLALARKASAFLSTGGQAQSALQNIDCADDIGVLLESTLDAVKLRLGGAVLARDVLAGRTGLAGVMRGHGDELSPVPRQLVLELPPELVPPLIEYGFVEPRLGPDVSPRRLGRAPGRSAHVPNFKVLDAHDGVGFADRGRGLVQEVLADMGDAAVDLLDSPFGLEPVLAELHLATHPALVAPKSLFVLSETVEGNQERGITEGGKPGDAHIDADGGGGLPRRRGHLAFGLDARIPPARRLADGDVLGYPENLPAVALA